MKLLITDSLFIFNEHKQKLKDAGFEIERLNKPEATEDELIEVLKNKDAYILGGIEKVTDKVINSTDTLKSIVFTGADWRHFIPGFDLATKKGIAIANTPKANAVAVAEYTMTAILAMTRNFAELTTTGDKTFQTTGSLYGKTVGIIGMGSIGELVARSLKTFGANVIYFSRTRKESLEQEIGIRYVDFNTLLSESDVVTLHASKEIGDGFMNKEKLSLMKDNALIVNCGFTGSFNSDDLYKELSSKRLRAFQDDPIDERFTEFPYHVWLNSNAHTAYNTHQANMRASDMAVSSIISLSKNGTDEYKVN